jgi:hypothetical protein
LYYESDWEQKRKEIIMNKTTKTILIVIGSLLVLCACASAVLLGTGAWSIGKLVQFAENNTTEDPQKVAQMASEIATYDVPEGFRKQYGMRLGSWSLVQYMTGDENTILFVTQFPAGTSINVDQMMRQIQSNSRNPNSPWYNTDMALVEQKPVTIRGQETTLNISEGTTKEGVFYRMANAEFQGDGEGPALFMIVGPADQWNDQTVEDFIASIQ